MFLRTGVSAGSNEELIKCSSASAECSKMTANSQNRQDPNRRTQSDENAVTAQVKSCQNHMMYGKPIYQMSWPRRTMSRSR